MQHRAAGHHVVHQLVRRDAEAVDRHPLPADVGDVERARNAGICAFGIGAQQRTLASASRRDALRQPRLLVAVADEHERERLVAQQRGRIEQHVERVRQAHASRHSRRRAAALARPRDGLRDIGAQRPRRRAHSSGAMPLGTMCSLRRSRPCAAMCSAPSAASRPRRRHRGRRRSRPSGTARRTDAAATCRESSIGDSGPQVVHFVDQLGRRGAEPRDAARDPDVHRIGAGRDHHVGPEFDAPAAALRATAGSGRPRCCSTRPTPLPA